MSRHQITLLVVFLFFTSTAAAQHWTPPLYLDNQDAWISTTEDYQGAGGELGYYCQTKCVSIVGIPVDCSVGGSIPILVSVEYSDTTKSGVTYGALGCIIPAGDSNVAIYTLSIYQDNQDVAENMIARATRIGIALGLDEGLQFEAYRFDLGGSMKALADLYEKMGNKPTTKQEDKAGF